MFRSSLTACLKVVSFYKDLQEIQRVDGYNIPKEKLSQALMREKYNMNIYFYVDYISTI